MKNIQNYILDFLRHKKEYESNKIRIERSLKDKRKTDFLTNKYDPSKYFNYYTKLVRKENSLQREKELLIQKLNEKRNLIRKDYTNLNPCNSAKVLKNSQESLKKSLKTRNDNIRSSVKLVKVNFKILKIIIIG